MKIKKKKKDNISIIIKNLKDIENQKRKPTILKKNVYEKPSLKDMNNYLYKKPVTNPMNYEKYMLSQHPP